MEHLQFITRGQRISNISGGKRLGPALDNNNMECKGGIHITNVETSIIQDEQNNCHLEIAGAYPGISGHA